MTKFVKILLTAAIALGGLSLSAHAQAQQLPGQNDAEGDISSQTNQGGSSSSGDAVGGQVVGVVSAGDTSVDSTNRSENVDVESGDAEGSNTVTATVGQVVEGTGENELDGGDISNDVGQAADASTGDAVGGAVIGVVTSAGGTADIVAANTSEDVDVETGDAFADNVIDLADTDVGQLTDSGDNEADGDISNEYAQAATTASGDGVGGQVLGVVSAGVTTVDATNSSTDVDIETGESESFNFIDSIVAQLSRSGAGDNELEEGADISSEASQAAESTSGDGVGGQVIGVVTSAGGSAEVVGANTSEDVDIETGDTFADNFIDFGDVGQVTALGGGNNDADDDISAEFGQAAVASSGDGVGGQVLGIVSAGDASVDATNESTDVDVETGLASADNFIDSYVGQNTFNGGGDNFSDGEISSLVTQNSTASSGDAVAGQVAGVVTSAGGSADLVLANTSEDVDGETGDSFMFNATDEFVGQNAQGEGDV